MSLRVWTWVLSLLRRDRAAEVAAPSSPDPVPVASFSAAAAMDRAPAPPVQHSVSTTRLLALKALNRSCGEECVTWAIGQIERGKTERHVLMLAGMCPPFHHFEMAALRDRTF
jgi:hypothetical protein